LALYLFLQDGAPLYAGDIAGGSLYRILPGVRLQNIWGAAVIHTGTLAFCLKSTGVSWDGVAARFKLIHASRPTDTPPASVSNVAPAATPELIHTSRPTDTPPASVIHSDSDPGAASAHTPPTPSDELWPPDQQTPPPSFEPESIEAEEFMDSGICESCPHAIRQERINPFPSVFPHSEWVKISCPGPTGWWHYITGRIYSGSDVAAKAVGVPGEYGMAPPIWLEGFGTYMRSVTPDAHGYWLMFQDPETGEVLDMGLSPRDA
jgi:hypothetical protein